MQEDHCESNADHWKDHEPDLALPPYWFFISDGGQLVLQQYIKPDHAIGIHVPVAMPDNPDDRPTELQGYDLFTEPGQTHPLISTN